MEVSFEIPEEFAEALKAFMERLDIPEDEALRRLVENGLVMANLSPR